MNFRLGTFLAAMMAMMAAAPASAAIIYDSGWVSLSSGDPTQLGRLSRNGIPQDWTGGEPYPGELNLSTSYHYRTFDIAVTNAPYIQISIDDPDTAIFASAYIDSYDPTAKATSWLGDAGSSGNQFGNPAFFQVIVPTGHHLVLVANDVSPSAAGLGHAFNFLVEGFIDTEYTDPPSEPSVPEPLTLALFGAGLAGIAGLRRRRNTPA